MDEHHTMGADEQDVCGSPSTSETSMGSSTSAAATRPAAAHTTHARITCTRSIPLPDKPKLSTDSTNSAHSFGAENERSSSTRLRSVSIGSEVRTSGGGAWNELSGSRCSVLRTDSLVLDEKDAHVLTPAQQLIRQLSRSNSFGAAHNANQLKRTLSKLSRAGNLAARLNRATSSNKLNQTQVVQGGVQLTRQQSRKSATQQFISYVEIQPTAAAAVHDHKGSSEHSESESLSMSSQSRQYWHNRRRLCGGRAWAQFRGATEVCICAVCVSLVCCCVLWHRRGRVHPAFAWLTASSVLVLIIATAYLLISAVVSACRSAKKKSTIHRQPSNA